MKKFLALVAVVALVAFAAPAFAANPFMDVPMNSWAYDAISQLSAVGVVSGYPDGTFKGNQPMTRYEMASIVARALAVVDMNKASKQDVEMLKKLVVEFKDELDALGVQVDELDSRVAVLEENLGGWALNGEFELRFRNYSDSYDENKLYFDDARITMSKVIDDKVKFVARFESQGTDLVDDGKGDGFRWEKFYLDVALPWDSSVRIGRFPTCWLGFLSVDNDPLYEDTYHDGFWFSKAFSMGKFDLAIFHEETGDKMAAHDVASADYFQYKAMLSLNFNEQFSGGLYANMVNYDDVTAVASDAVDHTVYAAWLTFLPMSGVEVTGAYYLNDLDVAAPAVDDASAMQFIVQVDQDVFGFTSARVEYYDYEKGFYYMNDPFANYQKVMGVYNNGSVLADDTTELFVKLTQTWNDKWSTFQRFVSAESDASTSDVTDYSFGVGYNYTSNLYFELVYDAVDYDGMLGVVDQGDSNNLIQFKTYVSF